MRRCTAYGLAVETQLDIPGVAYPDSGGDFSADISVRFGAAHLDGPRSTNGPYRYDGTRLEFDAPGVGSYLCEEGAIAVEPAAHADSDGVAALLTATALPAVLWMRNRLVLHAAAVVMPGCDVAIAIAGESGAGKSTVLDQLVAGGAKVLADDSLALERSADGFIASGLPSGYFLRHGEGSGRVFRVVPQEQSLASARLGSVFVLRRESGQGSGRLDRLGQVDAIEHVLRNRHRPRIPEIIGRSARVFADCAELARASPLFLWRRQAGSIALAADEWTALVRGATGRRNA